MEQGGTRFNVLFQNQAICPECKGTGSKIMQYAATSDHLVNQMTCHYCKGLGKVRCSPN
jgi:DnaJ-class molecular chaperone